MILAVRALSLTVCALAAVSASAKTDVKANEAAAIPAEIRSYPIRNFKIGSTETRFGPLEFVGGMELRSSLDHFGSMSGFRFLEPGGNFIGVTDSGFWFFGGIERDSGGRPTGAGQFSMQPMVDSSGVVSGEKWHTDAEGLAVRGSQATVGFEREHRIATFDIKPGEMEPETGQLDFLVPPYELRRNKGFETVVYSPADSPLKGARIVISERSIDKQGNIFAAVIEGPKKGVFKVVRHGTFDITDGDFLDNGDLLLLERSFNMAEGVKMRLRRVDTATIGKGRTVDGEFLFEADLNHQIDNMEGLDAWVDNEGRQRISMVSDDNHSILQRNLYLEFILED